MPHMCFSYPADVPPGIGGPRRRAALSAQDASCLLLQLHG
jgi:hypothetical protein